MLTRRRLLATKLQSMLREPEEETDAMRIRIEYCGA